MKAFLKKTGGVLLHVAVGASLFVPILGLVGGFGTGIAYGSIDSEFDKYYQYDKVQQIVEDTLKEELADLDEARENGDISDGEYVKMRDKLNQKSHIKELTKNAANEVFADDADYKGIIKRDGQLSKASISLFSIGGGTLVLFLAEYFSGFCDWLLDKGDAMIDGVEDDYSYEKRERRKQEKAFKKKQKAYQKELEEYTEEIEK